MFRPLARRLHRLQSSQPRPTWLNTVRNPATSSSDIGAARSARARNTSIARSWSRVSGRSAPTSSTPPAIDRSMTGGTGLSSASILPRQRTCGGEPASHRPIVCGVVSRRAASCACDRPCCRRCSRRRLGRSSKRSAVAIPGPQGRLEPLTVVPHQIRSKVRSRLLGSHLIFGESNLSTAAGGEDGAAEGASVGGRVGVTLLATTGRARSVVTMVTFCGTVVVGVATPPIGDGCVVQSPRCASSNLNAGWRAT